MANPNNIAKKLLKSEEAQAVTERTRLWQNFDRVPPSVQGSMLVERAYQRFRTNYLQVRLRNELIDNPALLGPAEQIDQHTMSVLARAVIAMHDTSDERINNFLDGQAG